MLRGKGILDNDEARAIITELYEEGHRIADQVIEQIMGNQMSREEREDMIQDGFLRLIIHAESLKEKNMQQRMSYMKSTMRNIAIDEGRRITKNRMSGLGNAMDNVDSVDVYSDEPTPEEHYLINEETRARRRYLNAAMLRLDPRDRSLLAEKYGNCLSDREIGEKLGIRERNITTYLSRARRRLRVFYEEELNKDPR